jgi:16S rRNA (uracil1498-N3)-methyltransferase
MTRLCVENLSDVSTSIPLDRNASHYVKKVLRYSMGDELIVFDGSGKEYLCSISDLKEKVILNVKEIKESKIKPSRDIILLQGLLKGKKMDLVVQKATEIGVKTIVPVITGRVSKGDRWRKIANEALRQCGRVDTVAIEEAVNFSDLVNNALPHYEDALKIVFYEKSRKPLHVIEEELKGSKKIVLFTGPEGGFSSEETQLLEDNGFQVLSMGDLVLRAETAAIVASGIIHYICNKQA